MIPGPSIPFVYLPHSGATKTTNLQLLKEQDQHLMREMSLEEISNRRDQFIAQQLSEISSIFSNIQQKIKAHIDRETLLNQSYKELSQSTLELENTLKLEINSAPYNDQSALTTAKKYEQAINDSFDPTKSFKQQKQSAKDFRNEARHSKYSEVTKMVIGYAAIAIVSFVVLTVTLASGGSGLLPSIGVAAFLSQFFGVMGCMFGSGASNNPTENRGQTAYKSLNNLITTKHSFFKSSNEHKIQNSVTDRMRNQVPPETPSFNI